MLTRVSRESLFRCIHQQLMDLLAWKYRLLHSLPLFLNFLSMSFLLFQIDFKRSSWFLTERHAEPGFVFGTAKHFLDGFDWTIASLRTSSTPRSTDRAEGLSSCTCALERRKFSIWTFSSPHYLINFWWSGTRSFVETGVGYVFNQLTDCHPDRLLFVWIVLLRRDYTSWVSSLMFFYRSLFLHRYFFSYESRLDWILT